MSWSLAAIALILLAFASLSGRLPGTPLTAPMLFTLAGLNLIAPQNACKSP